MIRKYRVKSSNIWNIDEKGFLIGICNKMRRIVSIRALRSKKLLGASQDGSREFISLLAGICADGTAVLPALIYQGKSGDLMDSWIEDFDHSRQLAYFAASQKGWTNENLGIDWLQRVFESNTRQKAGNGWRLLIVDGHSSHVNMRFVEICDQNRILLVILPPHSTHRLQPLDLKIFSPLSTYYSQEIDRVIQRSCGLSRITKRNFWTMFKTAWEKALTKANILSAFAAAGIHPWQPSKVLDQIKYTTPSPPSSDIETNGKTPGSVRAVRRQVKAIRKAQGSLDREMDKLARAAENLAIKNEILEHELSGVREALQEETKRRKRGRKMGLFEKDEPGQAQFFSPGKIAAARARELEMENQKEQDRIDKELKAQAKATDRQRKAREAKDRVDLRRKMAADKRALKEAAKEARKQVREANLQLRLEQQTSLNSVKASTASRKRKLTDTLEVEPVHVHTSTARNGRTIAPPKRFRE